MLLPTVACDLQANQKKKFIISLDKIVAFSKYKCLSASSLYLCSF